MRAAFRSWVASLDPAVRKANQAPSAWIATTVLSVAFLLLISFAPGVREFFRLDFATAALCLLVPVLIGMLGNWIDSEYSLSDGQYGVAVLLGSLALKGYAAALVVLSELPGAFALGGVLVVICAYHGALLRSTPRWPFQAATTVTAVVGAALFRPENAHLAILATSGATALGAEFLLGSMGVRDHRERRRQEQLRSALQAQVLAERTEAVSRLRKAILGILQRNHDASNALTTSLLDAEVVLGLAKHSLDAEATDQLHEVADSLRTALVRLKGLVDGTRFAGESEFEETAPTRTPADLGACAREVVASARRRFPQVSIILEGAERELPPALLVGGEETLHRALENLAINACEGRGESAARTVRITLVDQPATQVVGFQVQDDGPGFAAEQIEAPIEALATSKPDGMGLGLFTTDRLVRASGGELVRANALGGGAVVSVYLSSGAAPE